MKKLGFLGSAILIAVVIAFGIKTTQKKPEMNNEVVAQVEDKAATGDANIGGSFNLTDHNGNPKSDTDFKGKKMLVFFGFTNCPSVCPVEMATITEALKILGDKAANLQPVMISIDPERDTPEQLNKFLKNFDPRFTGLTGDKQQIEDVEKAYKVYSAKVPEDKSAGEYNMNHSSFSYVMNEEGKYVGHIQSGLSADEFAKQLEKLL